MKQHSMHARLQALYETLATESALSQPLQLQTAAEHELHLRSSIDDSARRYGCGQET